MTLHYFHCPIPALLTLQYWGGGFKFLVHRAVWCYRCLEISGPLVWCYWWHPPHSIRHKLDRKSSLDRPTRTSNLPHFFTTITFSDPPSLHHQKKCCISPEGDFCFKSNQRLISASYLLVVQLYTFPNQKI